MDILAPPTLTGQKLYHYTTQEGLLGIVKSRSLWTTSVFHLNDSAEFDYTLDLAIGKLEERVRDSGEHLAIKVAWEGLLSPKARRVDRSV